MNLHEATEKFFIIHPNRWPDVFARLSPGVLWSSFMPGTDPSRAIAMMEDQALPLITLSISALSRKAKENHLREVGIPFRNLPEDKTIAAALFNEAIRDKAAKQSCIDQRVDLPQKSQWISAIAHCIDDAAFRTMDGVDVDNLDILLKCENIDLTPMLSFADENARVRFGTACALCHQEIEFFRRHYLRRSLLEGLMLNIKNVLEDIPHIILGRDETGWPIWCEPKEKIARIPEHLIDNVGLWNVG